MPASIVVIISGGATDATLPPSGFIRATNEGFRTPADAIAWINANFPNSPHTFRVAAPFASPWISWSIFYQN